MTEFAYSFVAPNGVRYTITKRFVSTGAFTVSKKSVWDLTSNLTGTRSYSKKDLATALAARLEMPLQKWVAALDKIELRQAPAQYYTA